jgi:AbrB family looped-hinge helix DNA binding protein
MAARTTLTRKGQVTIPAGIRRSLDLKEGDQLAVEQQGDVVLLRRSAGVAQRTAGILARYRLAVPLCPEEERDAFEQAVADEVAGVMPGT